MKKFLFVSISILILLFAGCSDDNSGGTNPVGFSPIGSNSNNNSVTFQVNIHQDQQHGTYFHFTPNVDVKIIKVEATINNQTSSVDGDVNSTISTSEGFSITANNPDVGDNWLFKISGKIANSNQDFTSTFNYVIPEGFDSGTGNVAIEITSQAGQQGGTDFLFKSKVDIKITKVDVEMGGATDLINGDGTTVYSSNNWYILAGYNDVASGQQWSFTFVGKIASNNEDYSETALYTVP